MPVTPRPDNGVYRLRIKRVIDGTEITTKTRVKRAGLGRAIQAALIDNAGAMVYIAAIRMEDFRASD